MARGSEGLLYPTTTTELQLVAGQQLQQHDLVSPPPAIPGVQGQGSQEWVKGSSLPLGITLDDLPGGTSSTPLSMGPFRKPCCCNILRPGSQPGVWVAAMDLSNDGWQQRTGSWPMSICQVL